MNLLQLYKVILHYIFINLNKTDLINLSSANKTLYNIIDNTFWIKWTLKRGAKFTDKPDNLTWKEFGKRYNTLYIKNNGKFSKLYDGIWKFSRNEGYNDNCQFIKANGDLCEIGEPGINIIKQNIKLYFTRFSENCILTTNNVLHYKREDFDLYETDVKSFYCGNFYTYIIKNDNNLYCMGRNENVLYKIFEQVKRIKRICHYILIITLDNNLYIRNDCISDSITQVPINLLSVTEMYGKVIDCRTGIYDFELKHNLLYIIDINNNLWNVRVDKNQNLASKFEIIKNNV